MIELKKSTVVPVFLSNICCSLTIIRSCAFCCSTCCSVKAYTSRSSMITSWCMTTHEAWTLQASWNNAHCPREWHVLTLFSYKIHNGLSFQEHQSFLSNRQPNRASCRMLLHVRWMSKSSHLSLFLTSEVWIYMACAPMPGHDMRTLSAHTCVMIYVCVQRKRCDMLWYATTH